MSRVCKALILCIFISTWLLDSTPDSNLTHYDLLEIQILEQMIDQQKRKLNILSEIKEKQNQLEQNKVRNELLDMEYDTNMLDHLASYLVHKNKQMEQKAIESSEKAEVNSIKNSIFEKKIFNFDTEIVDFNFLPIMVPKRTTQDVNTLVFASNNESSIEGNITITDMRGNLLLNKIIPNCTIQFLLPTVHPQDIFLGVIWSNNLNIHLITFSTEKHMDAVPPSPLSPYLRIINENMINLPEKLQDNDNFNLTFDELKIEKAISYIVKGNKYFMLIDQYGHAITIRSDLKLKNMFRLETPKVTSMKRHNVSLLFSTQNTVGFMKIFEEISDQVFWEGDTSKITQISGDMLSPNYIYTLGRDTVSDQSSLPQQTSNTESVSNIVIFEIKQASNKMSAEECKIFGKLKLKQNNPDTYFWMANLRGFLLVLSDDGFIEVFKTNDLSELITHQFSYRFNPFINLGTIDENTEVPNLNSNIREIKSLQGAYTLIRNPSTHKQIILSEFIQLKQIENTNWLNSETVKYLLIGFAGLWVIAWRWFRSAADNTSPLTRDDIAAAEIYHRGQEAQKRKKFKKLDDDY